MDTSGSRSGENLKSFAIVLLLTCACSASKEAIPEDGDGGRPPDGGDAGESDTTPDAGLDVAFAIDADLPDTAFEAGVDGSPSQTDAVVLDSARDAGPDAASDSTLHLATMDGARPADTLGADAATRADLPSAVDYFSACPSAVPKAGDVDIEIFILAGQSNAGGSGRKIQLADRTTRTVPVWARNQANGWTGAPTQSSDTAIMYPMPDACDGTLFAFDPTSQNASFAWQPWLDLNDDPYGPEVAFIADVQRRMPGHRFAVLKTTLGGSDIESDWNPNLRGRTYDALVRQIQAAKASLSSSGRSYRFVGMLWMQGENGAASVNNWRSRSTLYADLTKQLFASIRSITDANMPIVLGRIGNHMLANNIIDPMVSASETKDELLAATQYRRSEQVRVARETSLCAWVNTDGLPVLQEDDPALWYHHTSAGVLALGERFASAWAALVGGR